MANGEDRTPVLQNEDWWSCFIGWLFIALATFHLLPAAPKIGTWTELSQIFPKGWSTLTTTALFFLVSLVSTYIAGIYLKFDLKKYIPGFLGIFLLSFISMVIAKQQFINEWGISYVLFALVFGLVISNLFKVPDFLKAAGQTEFFVKIGLVCMGATIMFSVVLKAGLVGVVQAVLVATTVWFMTYHICRWFKVSERFSAIIASANAICGVSATIAAGGAIQGNPKEISYMVAWVLVCAVVLILVMPPMAVWMGLPNNMAGAWLGGVIDNTGAVIAAGEVVGGKAAVDAAAMVKMAQNVLIGFAAFGMALWATMKLERAEGMEAPTLMEVWYRFPKFVVGFMAASLIVSFLVEPVYGNKFAKGVAKATKSYRSWFFTFCFVSIGLETDFKELVSVGGGRPAIAYWISQALNAVWTLFIVWILWSGTFFVPPILPD
ncbi:YeiH family protein [Desulfovibrio ferrophilus]|uniref:Putative membrane protein n=1 Tax=Desulfovibrio ferrophilus TaxID=241368 RepID=A0A2Z6AUN9_9BACT|nr:putative sulfate exporter family transporter [Desulfovibrio ferrophilus]BBD06947.1 putative membrane protein [Desulfovibrio ferrophilus]